MSIVVNTNVASMNAQRSLASSGKDLQQAMERLSTGSKINSAADDAAGFAIAESMTAQVRGLSMSAKNASDAVGLLKVVENATNDVTDMLQRIRELAVQAQSGTNSTGDIANLQAEANALIDEIGRVSEDTKYNGKARIGVDAATINIQVGYNDGDTIAITTYNIKSENLGVQVNANTTTTAGDKTLVALKNADGTYLDISQTLTAESGTPTNQIDTITTGTLSTYSGNTVISDGTTSVTVDHGTVPSDVADLVSDIQGGTGYADLKFTVAVSGSNVAVTWKLAGAQTAATFTQAGASGESVATTTAGAGVNKVPGALEVITGAIEQVAGYKAGWGANQNRLEYTVSNLMNVVEFTTAARSRIQDADFAMEAAKLAKAQVLQQTGAAMLAQANAAPQLALQLIK
jgi:flagellin